MDGMEQPLSELSNVSQRNARQVVVYVDGSSRGSSTLSACEPQGEYSRSLPMCSMSPSTLLTCLARFPDHALSRPNQHLNNVTLSEARQNVFREESRNLILT